MVQSLEAFRLKPNQFLYLKDTLFFSRFLKYTHTKQAFKSEEVSTLAGP